ncbi:putative secreted protein (Por secretion system target) [Nonlabens dokdonensis]|jgi:ELWxxDGT repeat protein|uniref:Hyalin repeat protein n=2 Tax=Nonlabens dokdonensis TaxID=328515 RepID=L7W891_NONDD|nr:T9SS type A sorting domain-containing protein [Nonlabens dokdonensis]AGC77900.1 hyalin repeat protein [Nonlabens dokdonensis DSW-6]PZX36664.1 putative secreted protein (Por secretion system target) [Nonlabens dokdonensis]
MKKLYSLSIFVILSTLVYGQAPTLVLDINPGTSNGSPGDLTVFNNLIYFDADDSSGTNTGGTDVGRELWVTDGTAAGTSLVADIRTGSAGSSPFNYFIFNNALYFTANDGASELWTSDGTAAGTTKVDLFPLIAGDVPNNAVVLGNSVFLTTNQNGVNNQLTEWNGTTAIIAPDAVNPTATTLASDLTSWNNLIYAYMEYSPDEATTGRELYTYNPATDTYTLVLDISAGSGNSGISNFTTIGTKLYFEALGNLWETDGTAAGTIEVSQATIQGIGSVREYAAIGTDLYFEGLIAPSSIDQLFKYDTVAGTIIQISSNSIEDHNPSDLIELNGVIYYAGDSDVDSAKYLHSTNGITSTQLNATIKDVDDMVVYNNKLYFEGEEDGVTGNELFVFDPATASIEQVTSLNSISIYPNPTRGALNLSGDTSNVSSYEVYDLSGRKVSGGILQNDQINDDLNNGIYILKLNSIDQTIARKFIVE